MKNKRRRKLRGVPGRAFKIVLAAGAVLAYWYSVHLALDLKTKIDADEPSGEWFVQDKNENRPRYIGPQSADALLSAMRFDMGEEKSEAQTAELKAHFERVLERGAVFQDNMDMLHFGPALMRRFKQAAEYERQRVAEHSEDADFPSIRALFDLPESASWEELENALMDDDLKKWKDAKKQLNAIIDDAIKYEKESMRKSMWISLPIWVVFVLLSSWGLTRPFIQTSRSNSRGIRLIKGKGIGKLAVVFLLVWCAGASGLAMLSGPGSALDWRKEYLRTKSYLRETQETRKRQETARQLLDYRISKDNELGYSGFDRLAAITEIQRYRGEYIADSMLFSAAIFPISFGMLAWLIIRWRAALQANADALTEPDE